MGDSDWLDDLDGLVEAAARRHGDGGWRALIDALPQIVWVARPDGSPAHVNRQWVEFTGLTVQETLGTGLTRPIHPDDRDHAGALWGQATSAGEPYEIEHRLRRHDGVYRWMLGRAIPLRDDTGTVVAWLGTCTDIEDLKRARADLDRSRVLQRTAGAVARLGGWSLDVVTNRAFWSEEIYSILDYPMGAEVVVEEAMDQYLADDRRRLVAALDACARDGTPFDLELRLETRLGRRL